MKNIIDEITEELEALSAYYEENIKDHDWKEIPEKWEHYAEWYKELFGKRPVPAEFKKTT